MLGKVRWEKRQRGVCGVAGKGLKERENVIEGAARGVRQERVEDGRSLRDRRDKGSCAMRHGRAKPSATQFNGQERLNLSSFGERMANDAREGRALQRVEVRVDGLKVKWMTGAEAVSEFW